MNAPVALEQIAKDAEELRLKLVPIMEAAEPNALMEVLVLTIGKTIAANAHCEGCVFPDVMSLAQRILNAAAFTWDEARKERAAWLQQRGLTEDDMAKMADAGDQTKH